MTNEINEITLFDYEDDDGKLNNILGSFQDPSEFDKGSTLQWLEEETEKRKIFQVKNYDFLKKKREESIDKTKKKNPWTAEEVIYKN